MKGHKVVVTGTSRGIGLALVERYTRAGAEVFAACREASSALQATSAHVVEGVDVASVAGAALLSEKVGADSVDVLINNAGVLQNEILGKVSYQSIEYQMGVNALGPLRITEALLPNLRRGSKVVMMTSRMGSIADNTSGGRYGYRMSKAALNIASVSLARDLEPSGIAVGIVHPGLVGTEMIRGAGNLTPAQAAALIVERIEGLTMDNTGTFWHSSGDVLPW